MTMPDKLMPNPPAKTQCKLFAGACASVQKQGMVLLVLHVRLQEGYTVAAASVAAASLLFGSAPSQWHGLNICCLCCCLLFLQKKKKKKKDA
jgi:hypothetical protein